LLLGIGLPIADPKDFKDFDANEKQASV